MNHVLRHGLVPLETASSCGGAPSHPGGLPHGRSPHLTLECASRRRIEGHGVSRFDRNGAPSRPDASAAGPRYQGRGYRQPGQEFTLPSAKSPTATPLRSACVTTVVALHSPRVTMAFSRSRSALAARRPVGGTSHRSTAAAVLAALLLSFVAAPAASAADAVVAPEPDLLTIDGTVGVGDVVTVDPRADAWTPATGLEFTYQWELDGEPAEGGNADSFVVPDAVGAALSVVVTGTLGSAESPDAGPSASVEVAAVSVKGYVKPGTATLAGPAHYHSTLTAVPGGTWAPAGIQFSYRWYRDGRLDDEWGLPRYPVTAEDIGHEISADVCGYDTYHSYVEACVRTPPVTVTWQAFQSSPAPTITGVARVGAALTAQAGAWDPSDTRIRYQWYRDGAAVPDATGRTYEVSAADLGARITIAATGRLTGFTEVRRTSAPTVPVAPATLVTGPVSISGTARVGTALTAITPSWDPAARLTYQWLASGQPLTGATARTFTPPSSLRGKSLSVKVTATRAGHTTVSRTSASKAVAAGVFSAPKPTISGTPKVGAKVTAARGTWSPAASRYTYQWSVNGKAVPGASSSSYTIRTKDRGAKLTVTLRGTRTGYTTAPVTSAASVVGSPFSKAATPTITGTTRVGATLSARVGSWSPAPTARSYQWFVDGRPVSGATAATYQPTRSAHGKKITVAVRVYRAGYATTIRTSAPTAAIAWPVGISSPRITTQPWQMSIKRAGTAPTSLQVTAAGGDLSYQWQRSTNGGATWASVTGGDWLQVDVPSTLAADGTLYRVTVSNVAGSVTSATVRLTVDSALASPFSPGRNIRLDDWTVAVGPTTTATVAGDSAHLIARATLVACYSGTALEIDPADDLQLTYFDPAGNVTYGVEIDSPDDQWNVNRGGWDHVAPGECVTFGAYAGASVDDPRGVWQVTDVSKGWTAQFVRGVS
ncbi:hypothetical protein ACFQ80_07010 [Isoptericola sp. NPDC056578]|uniref:hypothetical protein n=1 Tax=Isoptericola sp. NPDC056578 TaxID=3345870 RepID=UPI00368738E9